MRYAVNRSFHFLLTNLVFPLYLVYDENIPAMYKTDSRLRFVVTSTLLFIVLLTVVAQRAYAAGEQAHVTFTPSTTLTLTTGQTGTVTLNLALQPISSRVSLFYGRLTTSPDYEIVDMVSANGFSFFSFDVDAVDFVGSSDTFTVGPTAVGTITIRALKPGSGVFSIIEADSFVTIDTGTSTVTELTPLATDVPYVFTGPVVTPVTEQPVPTAAAAGTPTVIPPTSTPIGPTNTPTITPTPTPTIPPVPECDLCGHCKGASIPDDYASCLQCLYQDPGDPTDVNNIPRNKIDGKQWTVYGCAASDIGGFASQSVKMLVAGISGITFLIMLYGGFLILTSQGDSDKLYTGKKLITSAIIAELLTIFATFLFSQAGNTILKIPGLG